MKTLHNILVPLTLGAMVATAHGGIITVPPDLHPGDKYRLAFVTDGTRDATSSNIADYDAYVTAEAQAVAELFDLGTAWSVIGSVQSASGTWEARDHTGTNPLLGNGVPIYRLDGTQIATNNADLWDGSLNASLSITPTGILSSNSPSVWTGTNPDGTVATWFLGRNPVTSADSDSVYGLSTAADGHWILSGEADNTTHYFRLYGISPELTVTSEPSTVLRLRIQQTNSSIAVLWPTNEADYILEKTIDLTDVSGWMVESNNIYLEGTNFVHHPSTPLQVEFFRLRLK